MKKLLIILIFALSLTGCGLIQKTVQKVFKKSDSTAVVKTAIKKDFTENTKITITEKADTCINEPGDTASGSEQLTSLINGRDIRETNNGTQVTVHYDPKTRTVHGTAITKPRKTHFQLNKVSTTEKTTTAKSDSKQDNKVVLQKKESDKTTTVIHKNHSWIWILVVVALAGLIYLAFRFRKFFI
jgi:cell wall-associated NlpC family hydrolase